MNDHALLYVVIAFGIVFVIIDFVWKVFGTQRRLEKLEKEVKLLKRNT